MPLSSCQLPCCLTQTSSGIVMESLAFDIVVFVFLNAQQKLTGSLGPLASSNMDEYNLPKLPLSTAPYSMAPLALADGLWSLICTFSIIFILSEKTGCSLMVPWAAIIKCWDTWHKLVGLVSRQKRRFVAHVFSSYKYPFHFSLFLLCKPWEKELSSRYLYCR